MTELLHLCYIDTSLSDRSFSMHFFRNVIILQ